MRSSLNHLIQNRFCYQQRNAALILGIPTFAVSSILCSLGNQALAASLYKLPYRAGESYKVHRSYYSHGIYPEYTQHAIDFEMTSGTDLAATRDGTVLMLKENSYQQCIPEDPNNINQIKYCDSLANYLVIDHGDGQSSLYLHLQQNGVLVNQGDKVKQGQIIAKSGNTGYSYGDHLHFVVQKTPTGTSPYGHSLYAPFADVHENGGVPIAKESYTSGNTGFDNELAKNNVKKAYREIVGREPNSSELNNKVNQLASGKSVTDTRREIASTNEAKNKVNQFIKDITNQSSSSNPNYWINKFANGATLQDVRKELANSQESKNQVNKIIRDILDQPSSSNPGYWVDKLVRGGTLKDVRIELANSQESKNQVNKIIQDILDKPSSNPSYWVDKLVRGGSLKDVRIELANSDAAKEKINDLVRKVLLKDSDNIGHWVKKLEQGGNLTQIKRELEQSDFNVVQTGKQVIAKRNSSDNKIGLNIYQQPEGEIEGKVFGLDWGSIGKVIGSQIFNGQNWWQVDWGDNLIGWSLEDNLTARPLFLDVSLDDIFAEQIYQLFGNDIIGGFPDGEFKAEKDLDRGSLSKFIYNALGFQEDFSCGVFPDVSSSNPFYREINTLKCKNVIGGFPDGKYHPELLVDRGQMAKFIANSFQFETDTSCGNFPDVDSSNVFYENITTLKCNNVIGGFPDGEYKSEKSVTRGATAKFIVNAIKTQIGKIQEIPLLPDDLEEGSFLFNQVPSGLWYDPPTNYGFEFEMLGNSLFTDIINFPTGIDSDNLFSVLVNGQNLGQFSPGESVNFVSLLGTGVSKFTIADIDSIDPNDPTAFPIQLAFNSDTASFRMSSLDENETEKVPEPSNAVALMAFGILGSASILKRKRK